VIDIGYEEISSEGEGSSFFRGKTGIIKNAKSGLVSLTNQPFLWENNSILL
jgi:hypothetical protein